MTDTKRSTLAEFIAAHGITAETRRVANNPNMDADKWHADARHWTVLLAREEVKDGAREWMRLSVPFSQGSAHTSPPTAADVLDCLAMDAADVENEADFENWCSSVGYDTDSRRAERIYNTVKEQAAHLKVFLGPDAYQTLLWEVDR
jgi:hypothetical protein